MSKWWLALLTVSVVAMADEPTPVLRSFFPHTREELTGRRYSGAIAQPVIGATEIVWGTKLTKWAWTCEASKSNWKAIRWAKGGTRLAAGLGGVAMVAENGVRAWVYFGLESDPTVSPLLTLTLGEDIGTLGGNEQKSIQSLSAEEQDALIKEQLLASGVDVGGIAACKYLPDFLTKVTPEEIARAKAKMDQLSGLNGPVNLVELQATRQALSTEFHATRTALNDVREKLKRSQNAIEPELTLQQKQLTRKLEVTVDKMRATAAELTAATEQAAAMKNYFRLVSPWARYGKEGFRKLWVGFKFTAGSIFIMDLEGRIYRTDSLSVDPSISPYLQWTVEDSVPKSYRAVNKMLSDTQQGWESLEEHTTNRFSEILKKKD